MLTPKIGDTVIIEATVTDVSGPLFRWKTPKGCNHVTGTNSLHIKEIIPGPIKVGEQVTHIGRVNQYVASNQYSPLTLLHIHQEFGDVRKWAVVAYKGDIPKSVYYEDLRRVEA